MNDVAVLTEQAHRWLEAHENVWRQAQIHFGEQRFDFPSNTTAVSQLDLPFALEVELTTPAALSTLCSLVETFPSCALHLHGDFIISEKKCHLATSHSSFLVAVIFRP